MVLSCRDLKKAQKACDKIMLESDSKTVYVEQLDLSDLDSIKAFAKSFKSKFNRLDILINNAGKLIFIYLIIIVLNNKPTCYLCLGLSFVPYTKTKYGFEMMFGTMHLGKNSTKTI